MSIINSMLKTAIEQLPHGIVVTLFPKSVIAFVNPELERLLGVSRENLEGKTFLQGFFQRGGKIFYPEKTAYNTIFFQRKVMKASITRLLVKDILAIIHRPDGMKCWVLMSTSSVMDHAGKIVAMVSIIHDVTDRKNELERLEYAVTASVDGLWDWDTDRQVGYFSPRYYEMLGYKPRAFPPTLDMWKKMLHPQDRERAIERFNAVVAGKKDIYKSEYRMRTRSGQYRWFRARGICVGKPSNSGGLRLVGTHVDITRERNMEETLHRSKELLEAELKIQTRDLKTSNRRLETILDVSSESIWVIDADGTVVRINRKSEQLLGIRAGEVVGKHYNSLVRTGIVDVSVTRKAIQSGRPVSMIQKALRTGRSLLVTSTPVIESDGTVSMVIVNERDLTQLNHLQEELEQARGESSRMKEAMTLLNLSELREKEIIAESKEMQQLLVTALKLSRLNVSTILILGESGTGKGLLAKFIHLKSHKKSAPFVQINCAALPETLLEAELFGYEKGAFTGARNEGKIGLFEMAQGGTLFLDELGELSLPVQSKLLKCLEDKEIVHLGGLVPIKIDCTVIAATNVDLVNRVNAKQFRQDLFFRLNTFTLTLPPLRKRPEDILELAMFFLEKYNNEYKMKRRISARGLQRLQGYHFPGNVRELKNAVKKSVVMSETDTLDNIMDAMAPGMRLPGVNAPDYSNIAPKENVRFDDMVAAFEKDILMRAMDSCKTTRAIAVHLGMTQSQVVRKIKKHALTQTFKEKKRVR